LEAAVQAVFANLRDDGRVLDLLAEGKQALDGLKGIDPRLDGFAATLADLTAVAEDLAQDIRSYAAEVDSDPEVLSQTLTRLQAIDGLVRRFGPRIEDVFNARESAIRTLEETSDIDLAIAKATSQVDQAQKELRAAALRLSELRAEVAARFSEELTDAARDLAMPTASFSIDLRPLAEDSWTVNGAESIEIIYSPAALQPFRSLQKIASGGELSRVMLAIKSLNARENQGITMVFDEIDAGIGGAVALKVAQRLKALAKHNQLLVVTHLAQIAACADDHWLVAKVEQDGSTVSTISRVEGEKRVQEIARMLAGSVDALSCEHAMKLINDSRGTDG
jgi:DNA repair protein RecN (Recombination protein N)